VKYVLKCRLKSVEKIIKKKNLDGILLFSRYSPTESWTTTPNIFYFSDFYDNWFSALLLMERKRIIYTSSDKKVLSGFEKEAWKKKLENLRKLKGMKIGIEKQTAFGIVKRLKRFGIKVVLLEDELEKIRMIKDDEEIRKIKNAGKTTKKIFNELIEKNIKQKFKTELDLKEWIIKKIFENGMTISFTPLVGSGPHSAEIHASASQRKIKDHVLLDFGCCYEHYRSDFSRTFLIRKNKNLEKIIDAVSGVQKEIIDVLEPGVSSKLLFDLARKKFKKVGLEKKSFLNYHALGHGVGLEIHEPPCIDDDTKLEKNMVFTIEPAVYDKKLGGVRIEDTILLKNNAKILTK